MNELIITRAKTHNLKSLTLSLPRDKFIVITGPSGSGKSSLAFDTIYAEGQRRYLESLSSYSRMFIGQMNPPDVESIEGLSPAIAVDQKSTSRNPRSTVGTVTEVYDYMRILYARVGDVHCPKCGDAISAQTPQSILRQVLTQKETSKLLILSPVIKNKKGENKDLLKKYASMGMSRARIDGKFEEDLGNAKLSKNHYHNVEVVVDRLVLRKENEKRITDSVEYALRLSGGQVIIHNQDQNKDYFFSEKNACPSCEISFPELSARTFSFNSPLGACPTCDGLGEERSFSIDKMVIDGNLSLEEGALGPLNKHNSFLLQMVKSVAKAEGVDFSKTPYNKLPKSFLEILFQGSDKKYKYSFSSDNSQFNFSKTFPGIFEALNKKYQDSTSDSTKEFLEQYMSIGPCKSCHGGRLNEFALSVKLGNFNIFELGEKTLEELLATLKGLKLNSERTQVAEKVLKEITSRLRFLLDVGLDYLTLNRGAHTLSGGEAQRIRLATQIGSALSGVLYVLDEPSIGLHQRDNLRLIRTLKTLRDLGNTVIVVEHDEDTILSADYLVDMGPGAGIHGGDIMAQGTPEVVAKNPNSLTGQYLSHRLEIEVPKKTREFKGELHIKKASGHNLKNIDVKIPLGGLVCITGVSGSGKSTLVHDVLFEAVKNQLHHTLPTKRPYHSLTGADMIESIIQIDQTPIGRTPRSNPATYTGLFDDIRNLYSSLPESQVRGYGPGRFSFNVKGGRCESCEGDGVKKIEMYFLPDVYITCSECQGKRYNEQTLSILYRGKSVADVFDLSIEEAQEFFKNHPKINRNLKTLTDVGLGYMRLGQSAPTLSGGEAQRLKLSRELSKRPRGHCLYILDEPTTGLHMNDIKVLLKAMNNLVDIGHTMIVIEHNLDLIKTADWVIDLGPEGGPKGGQIVAEGTPQEVAKVKASHTGQFLRKMLT